MYQWINKWDEKLFLFFNQSHSSFFDVLMLLSSNLLSLIPIFLLTAFVAHRYKKKDNYHSTANLFVYLFSLLAVCFVCFEIIPQLFSLIIHREKPCLNPNISIWVRLLGEDCNTSNGIFAVRPCINFCITSFVLFTVKQNFTFIKIILVCWSLLVSYSRIYLGAHYPSNVLLADIIGIGLGYIGSRVYFQLTQNILIV